jgi:Ca-activated chloride channel family protein
MGFAAWTFGLLGLLLPPLALLLARAARRRRVRLALLLAGRAGDGLPAEAEAAADRWRWRAACLLGAAGCIILALMQPQWGEAEQDLPLRGRDLILLLDTSLSMLAEDVRPNRLAQAKAAVRALVEAVRAEGGHRLALLTFAGRADVRCPPTRDYDLLLRRLEDADVASVAQRGTAIGTALGQALERFGAAAPAYTDVILIGDGEDHGGRAEEAAQALGRLGLGLYTVGIGAAGADSLIPVAGGTHGATYLIHEGQEVRTRMRQGLLTGLAAAGGGRFVDASADLAALARLYRDVLAGKPRRSLASGREAQRQHRFQIFALLAVLLLAAEAAPIWRQARP